jgi:hypothetical protein
VDSLHGREGDVAIGQAPLEFVGVAGSDLWTISLSFTISLFSWTLSRRGSDQDLLSLNVRPFASSNLIPRCANETQSIPSTNALAFADRGEMARLWRIHISVQSRNQVAPFLSAIAETAQYVCMACVCEVCRAELPRFRAVS